MASFYRATEDRLPAPGWIVPAYYLLYACTPLFGRGFGRGLIFVLLISLAASSPFFTTGDVNEDYGRGLPSFTLPILFLDLLLLSSDSVRFLGAAKSASKECEGIGEDDCANLWSKLKWGLRLASSPRGIGWSWQVKGVPQHKNRYLPRRQFVLKYLILGGRSWVYKVGLNLLMGSCIAVRSHTTSPYVHWALDIVEGWSGALWACSGLNNFYQLAAATTVAIGLCQPCEWPPFFGNLVDGWSVRQIWSHVWHQLLRRVFQEPGIRLARIVGLRKGSIASSQLQLYVAFAISMLLHKWCMYNAIHGEAGEFHFFMAQPLAITAEDFVQWCWAKLSYSDSHPHLASCVGKLWMFTWFSSCLPPFVQSQRAVGIMSGDPWGEWISRFAQSYINRLFDP